LEDDGLAAAWTAATSSIIAGGYGRYLSYLVQIGGLDPDGLPVSRVTRELVEAYIDQLRGLNHSSTIAARIAQLCRAMGVMAPTEDWRWLRRVAQRLARSATPARDDRARLLPAPLLFQLGRNLMQRAETAPGTIGWRTALWFRDGLMIAILCVCPLRARNVAQMMVGVHLQRRGASFWVVFEPKETKNHRPIELPLPDEFREWVDRYLVRYRPLLAGRGTMSVNGETLWISHRGLPLTAKEVGQRISAATHRELGQAVNPHLFRKVVTTELAIGDPAHVGVSQSLLTHADYRTTERAYNLGRAIDAARRHHDVVRAIRAESKPPDQATGRKTTSNRANGETAVGSATQLKPKDAP
jgi:site-specific recombinase XerD